MAPGVDVSAADFAMCTASAVLNQEVWSYFASTLELIPEIDGTFLGLLEWAYRFHPRGDD